MKSIFKKLSILCVVSAMLVSSVSVFAEDAKAFPDIPQSQVEKTALENAVKNGLLTGYETGEIKPYDLITRAQMGAIITRAFKATKTASLSAFSDMQEGQWYYEAMSKAVAMEAFNGDGQNLNPEANITFQEAFAVIARVFDITSDREMDEYLLKAKKIDAIPEYTSDVLDKFTDKDKISDWAIPSVRAIVYSGYWGDGITELRPTEYINRTEFAILMDNIVKTYINEPGEYTISTPGNVLITCSDVTVSGIDGDYDVFIGDAVKENAVVSNSDFRKMIIRAGKPSMSSDSHCKMVRMIGHECIFDYSQRPKIDIIITTKYDDSRVYLGVQEL